MCKTGGQKTFLFGRNAEKSLVETVEMVGKAQDQIFFTSIPVENMGRLFHRFVADYSGINSQNSNGNDNGFVV